MGQHSGSDAGGTVGKQKPLLLKEDIDDVFDDAEPVDIAALVAPHVELAINTYAKTMRSRKAPWATKVTAATKTLEFAGGKPASQEMEKREAGLVIHIHNFFSDAKPDDEIVISPAKVNKELDEAQEAEFTTVEGPIQDGEDRLDVDSVPILLSAD